MNPLIVVTDLKTIAPMMRAILRGQYKMPWSTFFWTLLCLIYFISPIDLFPDLIPLLGLADDGAFILLVLAMLHQDLAAFRQAQTAPTNNDTVIEAEIVEDKDSKENK